MIHQRSSRLVRLARICNRHRGRTFLAWLLALGTIQVVAASVGARPISSFRLPGTESQRAYDLLAARFPAAKGDTDQLVFRARTGTLHDPASRAQIATALKQIAAEPSVAGVQSPFSAGGRLTRDDRLGVATVTYEKSTNDIDPERLKNVEKTAFAARSAPLQVEHGGPGAEVVRSHDSQGPSGLFLGIVAAAIVLVITFGSVVAAGLPLVATLLALGVSVGVITLASHLVDTPDFASQLASLIGLGVGIDYALFVVTRYRAEVRAGLDRDRAVEVAIDTAGRTVIFAAMMVVIALLGLLLLGMNFIRGAALGAATAVLATMFAALTVIPALIGGSGGFIDGFLHECDERGGVRFWPGTRRRRMPGRALRSRRAQRRERRRAAGAGWERWSHAVQRRPWLVVGVSVPLLIAVALPATQLRVGSSDAGQDPIGSTTRTAYDLIAEGFGAGTNGSFTLVAELAHRGDHAAANRIAAVVREDGDFTRVAPPAVSPDGTLAVVTAYPRTGPQEQATTDALKRLRDHVVPGIEHQTGTRIAVGGFTASNEDFSRAVASKLPVFVGVVVLLSALLLLAVFRSLIIPIKAAAMNMLSIGAALGLVTLLFQQGHGSSLLGTGTGPVDPYAPEFIFAIIFGLSMDYEVFLISRVSEGWQRTHDASASVARGLQTTGRVISAAALIMVLVFASFALSNDRLAKLFGIGLASGVFIDAFIIRCLLVPAVMQLLGPRAWWLPAWLHRRLPRLAVEGRDRHPPMTVSPG